MFNNHNNIELVRPAISKPQAVVFVFGWLGARMSHVRKYSELYDRHNCATVTGCASPLDILTSNNQGLDDFALAAAIKTISILKANRNRDLPVLAHVFCGGGTLLLYRLETLIHKANLARAYGNPTELDHDLLLLGRAMEKGGTIVDSAFPDFAATSRALDENVSNPLFRSALQSLVSSYLFVESQKETMLLRYTSKQNQIWNHAIMSRGITPRAAAYVYSDRITNVENLEEVIDHQARRIGPDNVLVEEFSDSADHVTHLQEYVALVDKMMGLIESGSPTLAPYVDTL